jgi:short-subunit dehydrogenase
MAEQSYKTALITGASSGLGRGLALWLARRGTKVYAAARRKDLLETLAQEAQAAGLSMEPVEMDVANAEATRERIQAVDSACGGLDLVVANAGVGLETNARRFNWESARKIIDVNVTGAVATLSAVLPQMVERDRGHLVGVSSLAGYRGLSRNAAYSASKAFLSTFMESLRVDLRGTGVRVTCINPGFIKTEMTAKNKHPMPFLLTAEDAVERMGRAIVRGDTVFSFPWQLAAPLKLVKVMPDALFDPLMRKAR